MTAREILLAAAERIETHGWFQGHYTDGAGRCCAIGALNVGSGLAADPADDPRHAQVTPEWRSAMFALKARIRAEHHIAPTHAVSVSWWNDLPDQTAARVVATLRAAAAECAA